MTFAICARKELAEKMKRRSKSLGRRDGIINEALEKRFFKNTKKWPEGFFDFEPIEDVPDFEALRKEECHPTS